MRYFFEITYDGTKYNGWQNQLNAIGVPQVVDNRADLPQVKTRTLILQCQKDAIADMQVGEYVHSRVPRSEFVVLDATGHCPHMSAPNEVALATKRFLS